MTSTQKVEAFQEKQNKIGQTVYILQAEREEGPKKSKNYAKVVCI